MSMRRLRRLAPVAVAACVVAACAADADTGERAPATVPPSSAVAVDPDVPIPTEAPAVDQESTPGTSAADVTEPRYLAESSDVLFDQAVLHTFEIDLAPGDLAAIDADPVAEEYVEGSVTFDGETIGPIGVRYKGALGAFLNCTDGPSPLAPSGAKTCTKLSMKLKMNWEDTDDTFYGVKKVQLHSQNSDPTLMHERLGYWLFREMGVPAPRSTHARVVVNGDDLGVFALTEQIDGRFTRENFDDGTGDLYKEVWPFDADGAPRSADDFLAGLETNEDENPTAAMISTFAAELADAAPGSELDVIERWIDVDLFVRTIVVDRAIKHDDGPLNANCFETCSRRNFYWYADPSTAKLTMIPWDLDNAFINLVPNDRPESAAALVDPFGEITDDCRIFIAGVLNLPQKSAACDPLLGPISELTDRFRDARAELVDGPYSKQRIDEQLARWSAQIEGAVEAAAQHHDDALTVAQWRAAVTNLISDIDAARETDGR